MNSYEFISNIDFMTLCHRQLFQTSGLNPNQGDWGPC